MKKLLVFTVIFLEIWGIAGFFFTIILSFLSCCFELSEKTFLGALLAFAMIALLHTFRTVSKRHHHLHDLAA